MPFPRLQAFLLALSALLLLLSFAVSDSPVTQSLVTMGFFVFLARALDYASRIEHEDSGEADSHFRNP